MQSPYIRKRNQLIRIIKKAPRWRRVKVDERLQYASLLAVHQMSWSQIHHRSGYPKDLCRQLSDLGKEMGAIEKRRCDANPKDGSIGWLWRHVDLVL